MPQAVNEFKVVAKYKPAGDQPEAIAKMIDGLESGLASQTLLGVTGSGKTFAIANVIENVNRPTLVLAPNKTLAAQLYGEFKDFFRDLLKQGYLRARVDGKLVQLDDDLKLEPIPRAPSLREKPALAALRDAAAARAKALDLPDGLLAARRHVELLLVTRRWPSALDGWRRDVLHDVLMPLLP